MATRSLDPVLRRILREIEPTRTEKDGARRSQNFLREILSTGQMQTRIVDDYLSGSYARDTAVKPLDDVDIVFVIDPSKWACPFYGSRPSPTAVLGTFAAAIRRRYNESSVWTQRRSVRLELHHLDIDVVPAIASGADPDTIEVADRESDSWITSSPKRHSQVASRVNDARGGRFKPLVKLLKSWNAGLPAGARFKSFAIETMAARLFGDVPFNDLTEGVLHFFDFVAFLGGERSLRPWTESYQMALSFWSCRVPDTAGTGCNVIARVDGERRKKFVIQASGARNRLIDAGTAKSEVSAERLARRALKSW